MKLFRNKFFILGNIALVLAAIPLTLLFISRQQDVRSRATPATRIAFTPQTVSFQGESCSEQTVTISIDPGSNIVTSVELFLKYDATKFDISLTPNEETFSQILRGPTISNGQASITLSTGGDVSSFIQSTAELGTLTIVPVAATDEPSRIQVDTERTKVLSNNTDQDAPTENVFLSGDQVAITIDESCITGETPTTPTPTTFPGTITPTLTQGAGAPTPTGSQTSPAPTAGSNVVPTCSIASASPSTSGTTPFVMTLSAQGADSDGTITKATFNFGDGTVQDVTEGLGTAAVTTELSHTYQTAGNYTAAVVFTDNSGAVSASCTQQITVSAASAPTATTAPGAGSDGGNIAPTATATPTPPIADTGSFETTIVIIGGLLLVVLGGLALIAL